MGDEDGDHRKSYLSPEIGPDAIGAFFCSAAGLFRAGNQLPRRLLLHVQAR
jgi:hypothetical protein